MERSKGGYTMPYLTTLFVICSGYYTLSYGISLWKNPITRLAGAASMAIAVVGTVVPIIVLFILK